MADISSQYTSLADLINKQQFYEGGGGEKESQLDKLNKLIGSFTGVLNEAPGLGGFIKSKFAQVKPTVKGNMQSDITGAGLGSDTV